MSPSGTVDKYLSSFTILFHLHAEIYGALSSTAGLQFHINSYPFITAHNRSGIISRNGKWKNDMLHPPGKVSWYPQFGSVRKENQGTGIVAGIFPPGAVNVYADE